MPTFILPLDQITPADGGRVGGKAFHLGELMRAGLNVPPGFVLTTDAYRAFIAANGLDSELDALTAHSDPNSAEFKTQIAHFQSRLLAQPMPNEIVNALHHALNDSSEAYAVRSSALAEDLSDTSFAGQYDTYLNRRGLDSIHDAIKRCWASLWNERALVYIRQNGLAHDASHDAMGVLVQQQIPAQVSGVMFTLNPLNGREREAVIEATWGLGEALVAGRVTPDHFVVDWLDKNIISKQIAEKNKAIIPDENGTHEIETPSEQRHAPTLTDAQILALAELGERLMAFYGTPQDVEWALTPSPSFPRRTEEGAGWEFHILQSRPLTAIHFTVDEGVWTGANVREVMPGVVTPLSFSASFEYDFVKTSNEFLERVGIVKRGEKVFAAHIFFGHGYWRIDQLKARIMSLPGIKERGFDESVGIEPAYAGEGRVTPYNLATLARGLPVLLKIGSVYDTFAKENEKFKHIFPQEERKLLDVDFNATSDAELEGWIRRVLDFHSLTNYYGMTTSYIAVQAQDDFRPMVETLNRQLPREAEPITMANLMNAKEIVATARPILRMWKIARAALADAQVARVIRETEVRELAAQLQALDAGRAFWKEFANYIAEFYYLSDVDEDYARPRYDEDPTVALVTLKQIVTSGNFGDPATHLLETHSQHDSEEARVKKYLARGFINPLFRRGSFLKQMQILQTYTYWREETRAWVARAHYLSHRFFGELGRRWAKVNFIAEASDVFYLTREQVLDVFANKLSSADARAAIARYKRIQAAFRNFDAPWTLGGETRAGTARESPLQKYSGVGCGAGRACGRARVITDLAEAGQLQKDEILVAPYTNPGWTPLFSLAAGIVMEEGGLLSHGAVVAREVGIPAVLQIKHATKIFRDGQMICVDGTRGTVEVM